MKNTEQIVELIASAPLTFVDIVTQKITEKSSVRAFFSSPKVGGLILPLRGLANFKVGDTLYKLERGTILHVGPSLAIESTLGSDCIFEYAVIHFKLPSESAAQFPLFFEHFIIRGSDTMKVIHLVQQLQQNFLIPGRLAYLQSKGIFLKILEEMIVAKEKRHIETSESIDSVINYMHQSYQKEMTVLDIVRHFNMDRRKLSALFQKKIGVSPNVYLTNLRIQQAKLLIRTTDLAIAEVAESTGYKDHFYFSRVFKKETGFSPTDYRKHMS